MPAFSAKPSVAQLSNANLDRARRALASVALSPEAALRVRLAEEALPDIAVMAGSPPPLSDPPNTPDPHASTAP